MTTSMASPVLTHKYLTQISSSTIRKPTICTLSQCYISSSNPKNFGLLIRTPQLGLNNLSQWNGLRRLGISISQYSVKLVKKRKCGGKGVFASLFGVGAPEALVIGVVALLVFGPKGLAEVARNLGKTLREFQPTIRELQDVSREFKSTLEREIGLDDVQNPVQKNYSSSATTTTSSPQTVDKSEEKNYSSSAANTDSIFQESIPQTVDTSEDSEKTEPITDGSISMNEASSSEDFVKSTEEQLKSVVTHEKETDALEESQSQPQNPSQSQDTVEEVAAVAPPPQNTKSDS